MIKFEGKLSETCYKYFVKARFKYAIKGWLIVELFFLCPFLTLALLFDSPEWHGLYIGIVAVCSLGLGLLFLLPPLKYNYEYVVPKKVVFYEDGHMQAQTKNLKEHRTIDNVKYVVDFGEGYFIYFDWWHKSIFFICQKNLVTEESIEKFEKLFEGRIERIQNKNK